MRQNWPMRWASLSRRLLTASLVLLFTACFVLTTGLPVLAAAGPTLSGKLTGPEWLQADPEAKQAFCRKALQTFRASPSQSYIVSSNVQALTPEGLCRRLDQFYQYTINEDIPINQAANIAPLLFSDLPLEQP